ncbi:hypothetical protein NBRC116594_38940 [Shimia sp. NS0008-38b]|uniref:hypothetical protein n=1 Tax=Shimia sp. NS0008-38b TaxID=3127653 RepID=UPI0031036CB9
MTISHRFLFCALPFVALISCGATDPIIRTGPQAQLPYTPGPNSGYATPGLMMANSQGIAQDLEAIGVDTSDLIESVAPGATTNTDLSGAVALFQNTCWRHTPDIDAIAAAAKQQGLDVERLAPDQIFASSTDISPAGGNSVQVNIASTYTYECAVTAITQDSVTADQARQALFGTLGISHVNGTTETRIDGKAYGLRHIQFPNAFGLIEHAFVIQAD